MDGINLIIKLIRHKFSVAVGVPLITVAKLLLLVYYDDQLNRFCRDEILFRLFNGKKALKQEVMHRYRNNKDSLSNMNIAIY
jgi:hypothetical protein